MSPSGSRGSKRKREGSEDFSRPYAHLKKNKCTKKIGNVKKLKRSDIGFRSDGEQGETATSNAHRPRSKSLSSLTVVKITTRKSQSAAIEECPDLMKKSSLLNENDSSRVTDSSYMCPIHSSVSSHEKSDNLSVSSKSRSSKKRTVVHNDDNATKPLYKNCKGNISEHNSSSFEKKQGNRKYSLRKKQNNCSPDVNNHSSVELKTLQNFKTRNNCNLEDSSQPGSYSGRKKYAIRPSDNSASSKTALQKMLRINLKSKSSCQETCNSSNDRCISCHRSMTYLSKTKCCSICLAKLAKQEKYASPPRNSIRSDLKIIKSSEPGIMHLPARHKSLNSAVTKSKNLKFERDLKNPSLIEVPNKNGMGKLFHANTSASSHKNVLKRNRRRVRTKLGLGYRRKSDNVSDQYSESQSNECVETELNTKILSSTKQSRSGSTHKSILSNEVVKDVPINKMAPVKVSKKHKKLKTKSSFVRLGSDNISKHISDDQESNYLNVKEKEQLPKTVNNIDANNVIPVPKNLKDIGCDSCKTKVSMGQDNSVQNQHVFSDNFSNDANKITSPLILVDFQDDSDSLSVPENVSDVMNEKLTIGVLSKENYMEENGPFSRSDFLKNVPKQYNQKLRTRRSHKRQKSVEVDDFDSESSSSNCVGMKQDSIFSRQSKNKRTEKSILNHTGGKDVASSESCKSNKIYNLHKKAKSNSSTSNNVFESKKLFISTLSLKDGEVVILSKNCTNKISKKFKANSSSLSDDSVSTLQHISDLKSIPKSNNSTVMVKDQLAERINRINDNSNKNVKVFPNNHFTKELAIKQDSSFQKLIFSSNPNKDIGKITNSMILVDLPNDSKALEVSQDLEVSQTLESVLEKVVSEKITIMVSKGGNSLEYMPVNRSANSKKGLKQKRKFKRNRKQKSGEVSVPNTESTSSSKRFEKERNINSLILSKQLENCSTEKSVPSHTSGKDITTSASCITNKFSKLSKTFETKSSTHNKDSQSIALYASDDLKSHQKRDYSSLKEKEVLKETLNCTEDDQVLSGSKNVHVIESDLNISGMGMGQIKPLVLSQKEPNSSNHADKTSHLLPYNYRALNSPEPAATSADATKQVEKTDIDLFKEFKSSLKTSDTGIETLPIKHKVTDDFKTLPESKVFKSTSNSVDAFSMSSKNVLSEDATPELMNDSFKDKVLNISDCKQLSHEQQSCTTHKRKILSHKSTPILTRTSLQNVFNNLNRTQSSTLDNNATLTINVSNYSKNGNSSTVEKNYLSSGLERGTCEDKSRIPLEISDMSGIKESVSSNSVQKRQSNHVVGNKDLNVLPRTTFPSNNTLESMQSPVKCDGENNEEVTLSHLMNCLPDNDSIIAEKSMFRDTLRFRCIKCCKLFGQLQMCCLHYGNCKRNLRKIKTVSINDITWVCTLCHSNFDAVSDLLSHKKVCSIARAPSIPVTPTSSNQSTSDNLLTNSNKRALSGTITDSRTVYTKLKRPIKNSIHIKTKNANDELIVNGDILTQTSTNTSSRIKSELSGKHLCSTSEPNDGVIAGMDISRISTYRCLHCKRSFKCDYYFFMNHLCKHYNCKPISSLPNTAPDPNVIDICPEGPQILSVCSLSEMPDTTELKVPIAEQGSSPIFDPMLFPIAGNSAGTVFEGPVFNFDINVEPKKEEKVDLKIGYPLSTPAVNPTDVKLESKILCPKEEIGPCVNLQSSRNQETRSTSIVPFTFHNFNPSVLSTLDMVCQCIPKSCKSCNNMFTFTAKNLDMKMKTTIKGNKIYFYCVIYCTKCDLKHIADFDLPLEALEGNFRFQMSQYLLRRQEKMHAAKRNFKKFITSNCIDMNSATTFEKDFFSSLTADSFVFSPQSTSTNEPLESRVYEIPNDDLPTVDSDNVQSASEAINNVPQNPLGLNVSMDNTSSADPDTVAPVYEQFNANADVVENETLINPQDVEFTEHFFKRVDVYLKTSQDEIDHICSECFRSLKKSDITLHYLKYHDTSGIKSTINVLRIH